MDVDAAHLRNFQEVAGQNLAVGSHHDQTRLQPPDLIDKGRISDPLRLEHGDVQFQGAFFYL